MNQDPLFRGCTRPPMFMGVPYIPFFIVMGISLLLSFDINLFFLLLLPIAMVIMRQMTRRDDMIFRLLGLRWQFKLRARHRPEYPETWCFSPNNYRKDPAKKPTEPNT